MSDTQHSAYLIVDQSSINEKLLLLLLLYIVRKKYSKLRSKMQVDCMLGRLEQCPSDTFKNYSSCLDLCDYLSLIRTLPPKLYTKFCKCLAIKDAIDFCVVEQRDPKVTVLLLSGKLINFVSNLVI